MMSVSMETTFVVTAFDKHLRAVVWLNQEAEADLS